QAGLPVHDPRTISKKGTKLTLCNNVNRFSYCPQALEYSKSHEFDYVKRGAQEYGRNASIGCPEEEDEGTNCYIPTCKYVNEASCKSAEGADCCKSILNGECWHKCDICRFNMIGDSYYPYADDSIKDCKLVDRDNFFSRNLIYTPKNKGFRVTKLQNIEKNGGWDTNVWTCNDDKLTHKLTITEILTNCKNLAGNAPMVKGANESSSVSEIDYLCIEGSHAPLPDNDAASFKSTYGCPYDALICDESKGFYATAQKCSSESGHTYCRVIKSIKAYAEPECWSGVNQCTELAHDGYKIGNYNAMSGVCSSADNTMLRYYCRDKADEDGKEIATRYYGCDDIGEAVKLNPINGGDKIACGLCDCGFGASRISECKNTFIWDIVDGYFKGETDCNTAGYNLENPINASCSACPYDANFWKCQE
ncbi:MAG: hypothetical protein IKO06_04120, partial [Alphaproteobacteria bacterium]|nr:hypothetical protein [Alphaproteobacteria bacterium]